jgi:CRISPR-associated endonuclease/helicase Cas3
MKFVEFKNKSCSDLSILKEADKYYAHLKNGHKELLKDHIQLVEDYLLKLMKLNDLEPVIDRLIYAFLKNQTSNPDLFNFIKNLFFSSITYHDFGKINPRFQSDKMNNDIENIKSLNISSFHSSLSAYLYSFHHFYLVDECSISEEDSPIVDLLIICFSISICKHHSSYIDKIDANTFSSDNLKNFKEFLNEFSIVIDKELIDFFNMLISNIDDSFHRLTELKQEFDFFALFALLKLNYSLLTASDYYATSQYMNDIKFENNEDFGLLDQKLKQHLRDSFITTKDFNKKLFNDINAYLSYPLSDLQVISNHNLNILRQKLTAEVITGIEKNPEERIFYIEAPTGGGKTNMSMAAVIKLLEQHQELNKIFYIFPFTTLITQTFSAIKETFNLTNQHVTQVHSKAGFQSKQREDDEESEYGDQLKNQIDNLFVNYPITLMTHVKFFDILKSNKKDSNYLLHRLANSIVIIDELQAYAPKHWDKIKYFISNYARLFNIRFIIMSATLPKIGGILTDNELINFHHLIPDAEKNYLKNPNFSERVLFNTELLNNKNFDISDLASFSYEKSEAYSENPVNPYHESVFTIIEFIYKKTATEFYDYIINKDLYKGYSIFVLSGTILEPRRKEIINYLKDPKNRKEKILLITTQVVEAGVDIDMDLGFKNQSLLDSDEQLAGRVNRNVKKPNCELFLFEINEPGLLYNKDFRFKIAKNYSVSDRKKILQEKKFKKLYDEVIDKINKEEIKKTGKEDFTEYKDKFKRLDFRDIHDKFKLIENETNSIFIPVDIPLHNYNFETEEILNFEKDEIHFIETNNCMTDDNKFVSGEKIWKIYLKLIQNKEMDFIIRNREHKILNGIMSNFVISVYPNKIEELKRYFEYNEEYHDFKYIQYYKLRKQEIGDGMIYNYCSGLNEKLIESSFDIF